MQGRQRAPAPLTGQGACFGHYSFAGTPEQVGSWDHENTCGLRSIRVLPSASPKQSDALGQSLAAALDAGGVHLASLTSHATVVVSGRERNPIKALQLGTRVGHRPAPGGWFICGRVHGP